MSEPLHISAPLSTVMQDLARRNGYDPAGWVLTEIDGHRDGLPTVHVACPFCSWEWEADTLLACLAYAQAAHGNCTEGLQQ